MRKLFITLSFLFLLAVVANAQTTPQDVKKATTETKKDCGKCTKGKDCPMMTASKTDEKKPCCKEAADSKEAATTKTEAGCCKGMSADSTKCAMMGKK